MKIDVFFTPLGSRDGDLAGRGVVVIDVLRATSTVVAAIASGAKAVVPAASAEEAVRMTANLERDRFLLAGERRSLRIEGFALGNSPHEMTPDVVAGKTIFLRAWTGWCGPCREELDSLAELTRRFAGRPDVVIRLVSVDDDPSPVIGLLARDALAVEPLFGGDALLGTAWLERVPAAWIVSPAGRVVRRQLGPAGDDPAAWIEAAAAAISEVAGPTPPPTAAPTP